MLRSSLLYWFPMVVGLAPTPRTCWIEIEGGFWECVKWLDGNIPQKYKRELLKKAKWVGYPLFMRTDETSAKHSFELTCYVKSESDLIGNLKRLLDFSFAADLVGLPINAIVFREFIELDWRFKAFWGKLPVAPEVRVFIDADYNEIICWHFYWVKDAIRNPDRENWEELVDEMRKICEKEKSSFLAYANNVAKHFDGCWSVDFARAKDGKWILIDTAPCVGEDGRISWHPDNCPHLRIEVPEDWMDRAMSVIGNRNNEVK